MWAAHRRRSKCASLSVLLGSHVPGVIFPGVGAMPMISGACFSFLVHQRLLPRPGPLLSRLGPIAFVRTQPSLF